MPIGLELRIVEELVGRRLVRKVRVAGPVAERGEPQAVEQSSRYVNQVAGRGVRVPNLARGESLLGELSVARESGSFGGHEQFKPGWTVEGDSSSKVGFDPRE